MIIAFKKWLIYFLVFKNNLKFEWLHELSTVESVQ